ncbi:iron-sulfur cluster repair di-iron protein [Algoriphagus taiwanensis]|uniref:Iron-sulfur cluster repair di-iron protein n=1 Tax=Algoriphagus taiwanensis TaxID=1445656 RepID=A0ABQ6Q053_9BACT|nr:iron-sulfur cluster repair di-iron protein [Algoriphagus taiwanensis]
MKAITERKVGKIVAENFRTAKVFTEYGIDFCCKGAVRLCDACSTRGLDIDEVVEKLEDILKVTDQSPYRDMTLGQLIDHIVSVHHKYVEETISALKFYLEKIERVHGPRHPELASIREEFFSAADALTSHMKKEEFILFPYIKAMEDAKNNNFPLSKPHFGTIQNPIHLMEEEHDTEGERFRRIERLTQGYTPPADACQTYRVAFSMLHEFEQDLHTHIHLENNLLFPKAQVLYADLNS